MMKRIILIALLAGVISFTVDAQDFHMPQPSPTTSVSVNFSTSYIKLDYSRPSMKGRKIFGDLLHYGNVWRTGANATTKITTGEDLLFNGQLLPAGSYALYTIPEQGAWTIILNKGTSEWTASGFAKEDDVLRFKMPVHFRQEPQQTFSISVENISDNTCDLVLTWENVIITIPIKAETNGRIMTYLDEQLQGEKPPYAAAAGYYLATGQRLDKAEEFYKIALKENPQAFYMHWHLARVYKAMNKNEAAVKEAKIAADMTKGTAYEAEYQQHYLDMKKATK